MIANLVHLGFACIMAYCIFYIVKYNDETDDKDDLINELNNISPTPFDDIFETILDINPVMPEEELLHKIIDERFLVGELITHGRIGTLRNGFDQVTDSDVVMKFVPPGEMIEFLEVEYHNYLLLGAKDTDLMQFGVPNVLYFGDFLGYKVLIMQMLGPTLHDLKELTRKHKLSGKTILKMAIQLVDIFDYIHSKGLSVFDIQSSNIAIGNSRENMHKVYVFDFDNSLEISDGVFRKKDLLLLGLTLIELNGVKFPSKKEVEAHAGPHEIIGSLVEEWDEKYVDELCALSDKPEIFVQYFHYLKSLKSDEYPNYGQLKEILGDGLSYEDMLNDNLEIFDSIFAK